MVPELEVYQKIAKPHMQTYELYSGLMFSGTDSRHLNTFFLLALFLFLAKCRNLESLRYRPGWTAMDVSRRSRKLHLLSVVSDLH